MSYPGHEKSMCKNNCQTFREHALGVRVSGTAFPTRSMVTVDNATEKQWNKDAAAFRRLDEEGTKLQSMDGAAEFESKAQTKIERQTGRLFGDQAKNVQKVANGETY